MNKHTCDTTHTSEAGERWAESEKWRWEKG